MSATRLSFHPLTFVDEPDGVMVGRPGTDSYAVLPADGAALLHQLSNGMPVEEAAVWYQAEFGEQVDLDDFLAALHDLGFVRAAGEDAVEVREPGRAPLARALFSPVAWVAYAGLAIACVVVMVARPHLLPRPGNLFFCPSLILVQLAVALMQIPGTFLHEGFHVLAGRRLGVPSRLGVGRRLYFVVFETELNGLLGVPRRQRYLPFLAGMLADGLLFCGLTLGSAAAGDDLPGRLLLALAYVVLLRIVWQFFIFLRTDLYYVVATAFGCTDLHAAAVAHLRRTFARLRGATAPEEPDFSARDRRLAPWFAALMFVGVTFLLVTLAFAVIPMALGFLTRWAGALSGGVAEARFWDSAVSVLLVLTEVVVLPLIVAHRNRSRTGRKTST